MVCRVPDHRVDGPSAEPDDVRVQVSGGVCQAQPIHLQHMAPIIGQLLGLRACRSFPSQQTQLLVSFQARSALSMPNRSMGLGCSACLWALCATWQAHLLCLRCFLCRVALPLPLLANVNVSSLAVPCTLCALSIPGGVACCTVSCSSLSSSPAGHIHGVRMLRGALRCVSQEQPKRKACLFPSRHLLRHCLLCYWEEMHG